MVLRNEIKDIRTWYSWYCRCFSKAPVIEPMLNKKPKLRGTRIKATEFGAWKTNLKSI